MYVHDAAWYRDQGIDLRLGTPVTAISPEAHLLRTAAGEEPYARLLLATGAYPRRLALADESGVPVAYLRTLRTACGCARLSRTAAVAIVGAGWIGLEVAAAAREAGCQVAVHDLTDLPLRAVLGPEVAQVFADLHRAHGVELVLGAQVSAAAWPPRTWWWSASVPSGDLARAGGGLQIANGVLVDAWLRTSDPDIYAVGDIANHDHPELGRVRSEHGTTPSSRRRRGSQHARRCGAVCQAALLRHRPIGPRHGVLRPRGSPCYDTVVIKGDTKIGLPRLLGAPRHRRGGDARERLGRVRRATGQHRDRQQGLALVPATSRGPVRRGRAVRNPARPRPPPASKRWGSCGARPVLENLNHSERVLAPRPPSISFPAHGYQGPRAAVTAGACAHRRPCQTAPSWRPPFLTARPAWRRRSAP